MALYFIYLNRFGLLQNMWRNCNINNFCSLLFVTCRLGHWNASKIWRPCWREIIQMEVVVAVHLAPHQAEYEGEHWSCPVTWKYWYKDKNSNQIWLLELELLQHFLVCIHSQVRDCFRLSRFFILVDDLFPIILCLVIKLVFVCNINTYSREFAPSHVHYYACVNCYIFVGYILIMQYDFAINF